MKKIRSIQHLWREKPNYEGEVATYNNIWVIGKNNWWEMLTGDFKPPKQTNLLTLRRYEN